LAVSSGNNDHYEDEEKELESWRTCMLLFQRRFGVKARIRESG